VLGSVNFVGGDVRGARRGARMPDTRPMRGEATAPVAASNGRL
jgi:hypothetical protein